MAAYCTACSAPSLQQELGLDPSQQPAGGPLGQHGLGFPQQPSDAFSAQQGLVQSGGQGFPQQLLSAFSLSDTLAYVAESALAIGQPSQPDAGQAPTDEVVSIIAGSLFTKPPSKTVPINRATTTLPTISKFF